MRLIFCISYLNFPKTLELCEGSKGSFKVVTSNMQIARVILDLYGPNHLLEIPSPSFLLSKRIIQNYLQLCKAKRQVRRIFSKFNNAEVYFFFVAYTFFEAWLINFLSIRNTIFYSESIDIKFRPNADSFKSKCNVWFLRVVYKFQSKPRLQNETTIYSVSEEYLSKIQARILNISVSENSLERFRSVFVTNESKILYLTGGVVERNEVQEEEYLSRTNALLSLMNKAELVIKRHPKYEKLRGLELEFNEMENYIPVNLLLKSFEIVVGYFSATLVESANMGITTISLINYYDSTSEQRKQDRINFLKRNVNNGYRIHMPQSLTEILQLTRISN